MGAWGKTSFENDDAMDVLGDLEEAPTADIAGALREALETASTGEYIDSGEGAEAQAAAAVVSAAREGSPVDRSDPNVDEYLTKITPHVPVEELAPLVGPAIEGLIGPESELVDTWGEAGALDEWKVELLAIRDHLAPA